MLSRPSDRFYEIILTNTFERSVPRMYNNRKPRSQRWFDADIIQCLHKSTEHFVNIESKPLIAYKRYVASVQASEINDPTKFWSLMQNKRGTTKILSTMKLRMLNPVLQ